MTRAVAVVVAVLEAKEVLKVVVVATIAEAPSHQQWQ
jgi:hypothetical protein